MKDFISRKERVDSCIDIIRKVIIRDACYFAVLATIFILYLIFITSNLGA